MRGERLVMQSVHSLFLQRRFTFRKPVLPAGIATRGWWPASQVSQEPLQIMCLRLSSQLSAENADALVAAVGARVQAAVPPPCWVVLDLSATPALDHDAAAALQLLDGLLNDSHSSLRLVLPAAQARAAFISDSAGKAVAPDTVHISTRAAILAAYASLPGAALVTPALCQLLAQPPEFLALPAQSPAP